MRRPVIVFLTALLGVLALPGLVGIASAEVDTEAAERTFVDEINRVRAANGLGKLTVDPELVAVARGWAAKMSAADEISHNPRLAESVRADWQKLGENVGVGMSVDRLHAAFVASPLHYKNIVDPDFTHIGVGVVVGRDGALFTTHQFMTLRPAAAAAARAATVATAQTKKAAPRPAAEQPAPVPTTLPPARPVSPPPARLVLVLQQLRALDAR